ncbi:multicopper oxidase family protein [Micromonospora sp. NPDC007271]|uniref:multicopper oxidase family protein n=1 Tax=Micromonospora sp. NPDC007271 TaxID=3154587 RepID=UPI0033C827D6
MISRRSLLALGVAAGTSAAVPLIQRAAANGGPAGGAGPAPHPHPGHGVTTDPGAVRAAPAGAPFVAPMPVPPVLRPVRSTHDTDVYHMSMRAGSAQILPGLTTPVLGYDGRFMGPTIKARAGRAVMVVQHNTLQMGTAVHLHGGHVPASSDGHPTDLVNPGAQRVYRYPNEQRGATLWYHDHAHHMEAEHVYRGLHGFYLISDPRERSLRLPEGEYDVPIMLRDAHIDEQGALVWAPDGAPFRNIMIANGRAQPYFPVAARRYRLRFANAATHRYFRLSLEGADMVQVASDGGLLPVPVPRSDLLLSPGERADVVVDFGRFRVGTRLVLTDLHGGPVMRFDVVRRERDTSRLPDQLRKLPPMPTATHERAVSLGVNHETLEFAIDGRSFDPDRVDTRIQSGTTEIWKITNTDTAYGGLEHNLHLHLVQFRVLEREGEPLRPGEEGLKDTVDIPPGRWVRLQATFGGYTGRYVYHCHLLEHSSFGMMAQMEIV